LDVFLSVGFSDANAVDATGMPRPKVVSPLERLFATPRPGDGQTRSLLVSAKLLSQSLLLDVSVSNPLDDA